MHVGGLRADDECFRKVFDHSHDAGFIIDPVHDAILDVNGRACELLGYTRDEFLQMPASAVHPSELDRFRGFLEMVDSSGSGWTAELMCVAKSGERIPAEVSASVVEIASGRHVVAWARDIRDRKHADKLLDRIRSPFPERMKNNFGVSSADECVTCAYEFCADFCKVINFAVECQNVAAILRYHRLVSEFR